MMFVCVCMCRFLREVPVASPGASCSSSHYEQNGVDHIHFAMDFPHDSDDLKIAMEALQPYIEEGKVRRTGRV